MNDFTKEELDILINALEVLKYDGFHDDEYIREIHTIECKLEAMLRDPSK